MHRKLFAACIVVLSIGIRADPDNPEKCYGLAPPLLDDEGSEITCGRHPDRQDCPESHYCHIHLTDYFAVCCPVEISNDTDSHIVSGRESAKGRWPWMVSLERRRDTGLYSHTCGAALLTPTWILTAAHCVRHEHLEPNDYRMLAGVFNRTADAEQEIHLKQIIMHEDYDPSNPPGIPNDIAVAELTSPVDLSNPYIRLAKLPSPGDDFSDLPHCWATGWGRTNPDDPPDNRVIPETLQELRAPVHTTEQCQQMWEAFRPGWGERLSQEQHVCFAGPDEGVCHGDSGSPLNCDVTGEGDWVVAGVASWASGDRCVGAPGVYARVPTFVTWIEERVPGLPGVKPPQPAWP